MAVKITNHHLVSTVHPKSLNFGGVVPGAGGRRGIFALTNVSVVPQRSVSTARTSAMSSLGILSYRGRSGV